jgi:predicted FMN-binding regulatory protein PaiB
MLEKLAERFFSKGEKVRTIRDIVVGSVYEALEDYSEWYEQQGLHLPPNFATDPTAYTEALHKMVRAFELLYEEIQGEGELLQARCGEDAQKVEQLEKEVQEGLLLFGQNFGYMTDPKKGTVPGQ